MRHANDPGRAMKLWRTLLAIGGAGCLLLGTQWVRRAELPKQDLVIDAGGCRVPATLLYPPAGVTPAGTVVLLHGLSANRRLMMYLAEDFAGHGLRTYAFDLPGHGDNTEAFSFSRAQKCATLAVDSLVRAGKIDPKTNTLVGHSMGAAIAIRMADLEPMNATIAISPAPMESSGRMPSNLLVFSASADLAPLKREAAQLSAAAQGDRIAPDDFAQKRAFELKSLPYSTHTSLVSDRRVAHHSEQWIMQSLFPQIDSKTLTLNLDLGTYETYGNGRRRLAGAILGLVGILLIFPVACAIAAKLSGPALVESPGTKPSVQLALVEFLVCSLIGVLILTLGNPLSFLHLYSGSYLASLLLIVGLLMHVLNFGFLMEYARFDARKSICAAILGVGTILAVGGWMNWQIDDAWLNFPRWLRFAGILPVAWIFCFAEEIALGAVGRGWNRALRFGFFGLLRAELFIACLLGFYVLANGQVLLVLLFVFFVLFSLLQRLATDAFRAHTGSAEGAALFGAILTAWFVSVVFPLT
jgi:pimeloyl-ACP methyl ester carboxylesterase